MALKKQFMNVQKSEVEEHSEPGDVQERLLDAAEASFSQFGLGKTTMEDVARNGGMSRATVYRYFKNRDDLLLAVVVREALATAEVIKERLAPIENPGEYIVEGVMQALIELPKRPALSMLYRSDSAGVTSRIVLTSERLVNIALEVMLPVFEPALAKGLLRESVDPRVTIEWIYRILTSYLSVPSSVATTEDEMRELLRSMLLPALLK